MAIVLVMVAVKSLKGVVYVVTIIINMTLWVVGYTYDSMVGQNNDMSVQNSHNYACFLSCLSTYCYCYRFLVAMDCFVCGSSFNGDMCFAVDNSGIPSGTTRQ